MKTGDRVRKVRQDAGLSAAAFGERVGVTMNHVYMVEKEERRKLSAPMAREICRQFGVREAWLLRGEGEPYRDLTPALDAADKVRRLMVDRSDSLAAAVISALLDLDPDGPEWRSVGELLQRINETHK